MSAEKDPNGSIQASKERVAHYINKGFSQRDAEAEALLDARLAQPYISPTIQEEPPQHETVSLNKMVAYYIRRGLSPAVAEAEAEAEIRFNEQHTAKPYKLQSTKQEQIQCDSVSVPRIVVRRTTLTNPKNPEEQEEFKPTPPRAEKETLPGTTKPKSTWRLTGSR